jgi:3-demethoxyubiquinol 3-hydroxylase
MNTLDSAIAGIDKVLRVLNGVASAARPSPAAKIADGVMDAVEKRHSAGLMRVNHVGEICAQALYEAQGRFAKKPEIRAQFVQSGRDEEDHLAWTAQRLRELGARTSIFNPIWYAGAYSVGVIAARWGDAQSLGFVVETERQVEAHLASHLKKLPASDEKSRLIVEQMRLDEMAHGACAQKMGAAELPRPIQGLMRAMGKVMTSTAYYL